MEVSNDIKKMNNQNKDEWTTITDDKSTWPENYRRIKLKFLRDTIILGFKVEYNFVPCMDRNCLSWLGIASIAAFSWIYDEPIVEDNKQKEESKTNWRSMKELGSNKEVFLRNEKNLPGHVMEGFVRSTDMLGYPQLWISHPVNIDDSIYVKYEFYGIISNDSNWEWTEVLQ